MNTFKQEKQGQKAVTTGKLVIAALVAVGLLTASRGATAAKTRGPVIKQEPAKAGSAEQRWREHQLYLQSLRNVPNPHYTPRQAGGNAPPALFAPWAGRISADHQEANRRAGLDPQTGLPRPR
jgi:hypothetical protein